MHYLYIIYSKSLDQYYIGETVNVEIRLEQHNTGYYRKASTSKASDWRVYLIGECIDRSHARRVEDFIKKQESRKFIKSLKVDQEKFNDILERFK